MRKRRSFVVILAGLAMLGPFSIDAYLPAFASIGREFGVAAELVQQTLSAYLACFAGMMLFHGTLSDSFGRKPVILVALALFAGASLGAALAPDLAWLIAFRALQGLSAGAGTVIGRAMIRDRWSGAAAQKMLSDVTVLFALAPALAPVLGGWLDLHLGWRSIFVMQAAAGAALWSACLLLLDESLCRAARQAFCARRLLRNYWTALRNARFLRLSFALGFASIGFFVYVAAAPRFVPDILRLPQTAFAWLFLPLVGGMAAGARAAGLLATRWQPARLIKAGYALMAAAALLNLGYNLLFAARVPWAVLPLFLYTFGVSLASPAKMVLTLNVFPEMRGLAASLQAFVQTLLFAAVAGLVAPFLCRTALHLAVFLALSICCGAACLAAPGGPARRTAA